MRQKAAELKSGFISRVEYDAADSMSRSKMYNIPNYVTAPCQVLILAVCTIILYQLDSNGSDAKSNWGIAVIIAFDSALALVFALPWFFLEKRRPGQSPPANMSIIRAGLWQWAQTASHIWRLKQSLIYLIGALCEKRRKNLKEKNIPKLRSHIFGGLLTRLVKVFFS